MTDDLSDLTICPYCGATLSVKIESPDTGPGDDPRIFHFVCVDDHEGDVARYASGETEPVDV
jgi:hypothetical protein